MAKLTETLREVGKAVTFFPGVAKWVGREECIFLCQLLFWKTEDRDWIWKTAKLIEMETSLSPREQRRVRIKLVQLGILKEKDVAAEHKMYFRIDEDRLNELWDKFRATCAAQADPLRSAGRPLTQRRQLSEGENAQNTKENKETAGVFFSDPAFEDQCVKKLAGIVLKEYNIKKDTRSWRSVFQHMIQYQGISQKRIKRALIWYGRHIGELYVPQVEDAKGFRSKFGAIESRIKEDPEAKKPVELSDRVKPIVEELRSTLHWPQTARDQLPSAVQSSFDAYVAWRARRKAWRSETTDKKLLDIDTRLVAYYLTTPEDFVRSWFKTQHKSRANWKEWSGRLVPFTEDAPDFHKRGKEIVHEYSGSDEKWTTYIKAIG